jgi:hypothetical protein
MYYKLYCFFDSIPLIAGNRTHQYRASAPLMMMSDSTLRLQFKLAKCYRTDEWLGERLRVVEEAMDVRVTSVLAVRDGRESDVRVGTRLIRRR